MTYGEKEKALSDIAAKKLAQHEKIRLDLENDGFTQYSVFDLQNAIDAHTRAINDHGKFVNTMAIENRNPDEPYIE